MKNCQNKNKIFSERGSFIFYVWFTLCLLVVLLLLAIDYAFFLLICLNVFGFVLLFINYLHYKSNEN